MADVSPQAIAAARQELGLNIETMPRSVAIIMDGNGRWATGQGLPRSAGHYAGAKNVRRIVTESARVGLDALTLYSFSTENWSRPAAEIKVLMHLYADYLAHERSMVMDHNIQMRHLGHREGLPDSVLRELDETLRISANNTGMYLSLALNYSSRGEMIGAIRGIADQCRTGELKTDQIDEQLFSDALGSVGVPDPDMVVRTSGEMRLSNFLLWQISYAEFYSTKICWPDFDEQEFHKALHAYTRRNRSFGGLADSDS